MVSGNNNDLISAILAIAEAYKDIGAGDWQTPILTNSWVNYGGGYSEAKYRISKTGMVNLRGLLKDGTVGSTAFTLPEGFRPSEKLLISVISAGSVGRIDIDTDGTVDIVSPSSNTWASLDGISFYVG